MNERKQLIKNIILTEIEQRPLLAKLSGELDPIEHEKITAHIIHNDILVDTWCENYGITTSDLEAVRDEVLTKKYNSIDAETEDRVNDNRRAITQLETELDIALGKPLEESVQARISEIDQSIQALKENEPKIIAEAEEMKNTIVSLKNSPMLWQL